MLSKETIRIEILNKRLSLDEEQVRQWSRRIQETVLCSEDYLKAKHLALYSPFRKEVETSAIFAKALEDAKEIYFPQWNPADKSTRFFRVQSEETLQMTLWGIREPIPTQESERRELIFDLIFVPGVVFDLSAYRIGYGQGGYDRILQRAQGKAWGLAFDFQVVDSLPLGPHDVPCDQVITEKKIIKHI